MRVITYQSADAPEGCEAIARIRCPMLGKKGQTVEQWHPVIFHGTDEDAVRAQAQAWWDAEIEKAVARKDAAERLALARQAKKATA